MDVLFEIVTTVGSLSGLGAAAFLIYDRAIRDRPRVTLSRGEYGRTCLRIVNPADDTLLVRSIDCDPPYAEFPTDESLNGILEGLLEINTSLTIKPESQAEVGVIRLKVGEADPSRDITIRVRWQRSRHWWPGNRTTKLKRSIAFMRDLEEARRGG